jgi:membrane dipeptidase
MKSVISRRDLLRASAGAAITAAGLSSMTPRRAAASDAPDMPDDVLAFHRECLVLDLHIDTLLWMRLFDYDVAVEHRNWLPGSPFAWHFDLPRAQRGGLDAAVFGLVINPRAVRPELMFPLKFLAWWEQDRGIDQTLATLDRLTAAAAKDPTGLAFCKSGSDVRRAFAAGRFGGLAGMEGSQGIEGSLDHLRAAYDRGLRMLGLVHFQATEAAYPMTVPEFDDRGLTPFGALLVAEMERLGMVVDLAHVNARGVADALGVVKRPFVVSHTACRALTPHPRNLDDDQIRAVADRGGVIALAFGNTFVSGGLEGFLDHVEHAIRVGGANCPALGSDFDGMIVPTNGMGDVQVYPRITEGLLARGQPRDVVQKLLGENALRVITDVCG